MRRVTTCALSFALVLTWCLRGNAGAAPPADYERWYVLELQGERAGWMCSSQATEGDRITSRTRMEMRAGRGASDVALVMHTEFVETTAFRPISMRSVVRAGDRDVVEEARFLENGIELKSGPGSTPEIKPPIDGEWLTPVAALAQSARELDARAEVIRVRTVDPSSGIHPVTMTRRVLDRETTVEVFGRMAPATRWASSVDLYPGIETVEYADANGLPLRSETVLGSIRMTIIAADKELALRPAGAPDLLISTLVRPDRPIPRPRTARRATFFLTVTEGGLPDLISAGSQEFVRRDSRSGLVTVDLSRSGEAAPDDTGPYLRPSAMLGSDDEVIRSLVSDATRGAGSSDAARAEAIRRFVFAYIDKKNLGVGFAAASEVARSRSGDCTEHAVLVAAMLRADGIPSRVAMGLVYVDSFVGQRGVFGFHMWAQALVGAPVDSRWIDLDAALSPDCPFDATHILVSTSALANGETTNALVATAPLMGRLRLRVHSVE